MMPRANRHFLPGHIWHITHRCHEREFLLKFSLDRRCWIRWLFEARKRYGLTILNYMVTSNHVHLLVQEEKNNAISTGMQLVAGRTAQAYNSRKSRKGAFWEDRYHATAVQTGEHLYRCLIYIDLNMVRARAVAHPAEWSDCGYHEIQRPRKRRRIIDRERLRDLCGLDSLDDLPATHSRWVTEALGDDRRRRRDPEWSESIAVGNEAYVKALKKQLASRATGRRCLQLAFGHQLREDSGLYT